MTTDDFKLPTVLTCSSRLASTLSIRFGIVSICALPFCAANLSASDGYPRQPAFDVLHYRVQIALSDSTDAIDGNVEVLVRIVDAATRQLVLDLNEMLVQEVREQNVSVPFSHRDGRLTIDLQQAYAREAHAQISVIYRGMPKDGLIIGQNKHGHRTFFADNWPDRGRYWFPAIDHPADKATVEFTITAPEKYEVVANGRLLLTRDNEAGTRTWFWAQSVPIPTYCMVFGAAEFSVALLPTVTSTPLSYYAYPEDSARAYANCGRADKILECFTKLVGPYPYEKLALVQSTTRFGGMENASAIFLAENLVAGDRSAEGTVAHEIAHQWFGDSVTEGDWHHLWLSEGFATYFQMLFSEYADGRAAFCQKLERSKTSYLAFAANNRRPIIDTTVVDYPRLLNGNNYAKAAWVLHMLRFQVGDSAFFRGVRAYYRTYREGNAMTTDFQKVMEAASGQLLTWFFDQWLWRGGYPELAVQWQWDAARKKLILQISQQQAEDAFRFHLSIRAIGGGRVYKEICEVDEKEEKVELALLIKPEQVVIDPEETVLKTLTVIDGAAPESATQHKN